MLSVVIPALNAERHISAALDSVREADEVLIVDGGSTDSTASAGRRKGARVISSERGRGAQLHWGALSASGDWLLFLHADTVLGAGWREAAESHIRRSGEKAAFFRFRLDSSAWWARLIEAGVAVRTRLLGLPYGDQGLLISRTVYEEVGGFRPFPLMEDVDMVERIGRWRLAMLAVPAVTSADRWRDDGWLGRSARNLACLLLYRSGVAPDRIARFYDQPSALDAREKPEPDRPQTECDQQDSGPDGQAVR